MTSPTAPPPIKPGILTLRWGRPEQDNANGASAPNAAWDAWNPTTCRGCLICTGKSSQPELRSAHGHELHGSGRYARRRCVSTYLRAENIRRYRDSRFSATVTMRDHHWPRFGNGRLAGGRGWTRQSASGRHPGRDLARHQEAGDQAGLPEPAVLAAADRRLDAT